MLNQSLGFVLMLGMFWDFVTACAGTLLLLDQADSGLERRLFTLGTAFIGSAIVCVLNFYTPRVWRRYEDDSDRNTESMFITWLVRVFWLGAIILNFYTSFVSMSYYSLNADNTSPGAKLVILFITALIVISPMTWGKVWEERKKRELAEQKLKQY